ncbi:MAG: sodium-dependent transporter [Oligoflexia bacterium]|nr:sodium-dependent transporter [Oligoflexia bacterium]
MRQRAAFQSRFGFYMAAIGSAVGLGTLWRFPYVTGVNGGGAFVLLYIFFVAAIGLPALICELMLGKLTRFNIVGAFKYKPWVGTEKKWSWFGLLGIIASFVVLSYYTVVSGWVIHFVIQGIMGRFTEPNSQPGNIIDQLTVRGYLQVLLASVHLIITTSIVARGVQNGIEKTSRIFMPILFVIMIFLLVHSLFLPGAPEALRFLFYPDFAKLTGSAVIEALGHALFTLSLGFGAMIAYGSYLRAEVKLPSEAVLVAGIDTVLALCTGVIIFPIVFTAGVDSGTGPALLFKTMPVIFGTLPLGYWVGLAFFVCLYFAALSSSIALFEGLVAYLMDQRNLKRPQAAGVVSGVSFILALISAFSGSSFKNIRIGERGLLEIIDQVIINWMLPVVTLGIILFVATKVPEDVKKKEFVDETSLVTVRLYLTWLSAVKYLVPVLLVILFLVQVIIAFL